MNDPNFSAPDSLRIIEAALTLIGNASNYMTEERRRTVLKKINVDLECLASNNFESRQRRLFGPSMEKQIQEHMQGSKVLEEASKRRPGHTKTRPTPFHPTGPRERQPFRAPAPVHYPSRGRQSQRYNPTQRTPKYSPKIQNRKPQ